MMGHTHALSGAAVWLAAVPVLTDETLMRSYAVALSPGQVLAGAVICAGAALLPDIDHHNGRIANTGGPVTKWICKWIGKIAGGHRQATHSILFALGIGYAMDLLATHLVQGWWITLFVIVGLGIRGIGLDFEGHDPWSAMIDCAVAGLAVFLMYGLDMGFVGYAVTLGCLTHVAGDCLTPRGCPVFWPMRWRVEIPLIPRTDGRVERWVLTPLLTLGIAVLTVRSSLGESATSWLKAG